MGKTDDESLLAETAFSKLKYKLGGEIFGFGS